jgi:wyosine [tRNA(Phe)-imidazoG37] synthetase (radical SAM superfamily)
MATFLFENIIFGPIWSRRLGESLGINLLPAGRKVCNFNCIYCECGLTPDSKQQTKFPAVSEVIDLLSAKLADMKKNHEYLNSITFAGNGEPTLHPDFPEIIDHAILLRDQFFPDANIAVLSNATLITNTKVFNALLKADLNILKLDSALPETLERINCPNGIYDIDKIMDTLSRFNGKLIIQTLFLRGFCNNQRIDNTTPQEIIAWLSAIIRVKPEMVMIYSLARETPVSGLEKVGEEELKSIASEVEKRGIKTLVTP